MAAKRDYGSFSSACERYFTPMVEGLGFHSLGGVRFGRQRTGWMDGLFFQQSQWGSGDFSATVGFYVPELYELWSYPKSFGLLLGGRLSEEGIGLGDCWHYAKDKIQLQTNLETFAKYLSGALPWFDRVASIRDIAELYRQKEQLADSPPELLPLEKQISAANLGFLLLLSGRDREAKEWLQVAVHSMAQPLYCTRERHPKFVFEKQPGAKLVKPSTEQKHQLTALQSALARL